MPLIDDPAVNQSLLTPRGFTPLPGSDEEIHPVKPPEPPKPETSTYWDGLGFPSADTLANVGLAFGGVWAPLANELGASPTVQAANRTSNTIDSAIARYQDTRGVSNEFTDPKYSPWNDVVGTPYEKYWKSTFAYSNNAAYTQALKHSIDRQEADQRTVAASGFGGTIAGIMAGVTDPTLLIPGGGEITFGKGGWTLAKGALSGARAAALGITAQELGLHASQDTRTAQESVINIGTGTVLGAVLGGAIAGALSPAQRVASEAGLEAIQNMNVPEAASARFNLDTIDDRMNIIGEEIGRQRAKGLDNDPLTHAMELSAGLSVLNVSGRSVEEMTPDALKAIEEAKGWHRTDIIELIRDRAERQGSAPVGEPGVNPDHPRYDTIKAKMIEAKQKDRALADQVITAADKALKDIKSEQGITQAADVGAASTYKPTIDDLTISGGLARTVAKATAFSPIGRGNFYESPLARQTIQELTDTPVIQNMHLAGETLGQDVTNSIRVSLAETLNKAIAEHLSMFRAAKKDFGMSLEQYENAVGEAMRNNDVGVNDAVSKGAAFWRKTVTDPLMKQAVELKMLPEDVHISEAPSYFMRAWNREKLVAQAPEVIDRFTDHFETQLDEGYQRAAEKLREKQGELDAEGKGLKVKKDAERIGQIKLEKQALDREFYDRWEIKRGGQTDPYNPEAKPDFRPHAKELAQEVHQRLTGQDYGSNLLDPEYSRPIAYGPLKGRTFHIPDSQVSDLLNSNVREVMTKYARRMSSQIELTRKFGDINLGSRIEDVGKEYQVLTEHAKNEAERLALAKDHKNFVRDVIALRDMHLGTYLVKENASVPGRVARSLRNVNFILRMGGPALPHLSNIYAPALFHTMGRYMEDGIGPLMSGIDSIKGLNKETRWAVGLEGITHHQLLTITDLGDPYAKGTRFERLLDKLVLGGSKINGLNILVNGEKNIAGWMVQARLNDALLKGGDETWLAYSGLTKAQQGNVAKFLKKYMTEESGHTIANTDKWADDGAAGWEAARAYRVAVAKNVNNDIVTRGPGDLPLFAQTPLGSLFLQFRTFQLSAHQRMALRVLQLPTAQAISGMMGLTSLGILAATIKALHSGTDGWQRFKDSAQNPGYLVAEGLDNTAFFTLPTEIGNDTERLSGSAGYPVNLTKLPLSLAGRLANPDAPITANTQQGALSNDWTSIGGPTVSLVSDVAHGVGGPIAAEGTGQQVTKREVHAAQRLVPFNSYIGMRQLLQVLSDDSPYTGK